MKVKSESESEVMSDSSKPHGLQPTRLLRPWDFPGKSAGVGRHRLLHMTGGLSPLSQSAGGGRHRLLRTAGGFFATEPQRHILDQ